MGIFGSRKRVSDAGQTVSLKLSDTFFSTPNRSDDIDLRSSAAASDLSQTFFRPVVEDFFEDLGDILHSVRNAAAVMSAQVRAANRMNLEFDAAADPKITLTAPDQAPYLAAEILHELHRIDPGLYQEIAVLFHENPKNIGSIRPGFVLALQSLGVIEQLPELEQQKAERKAIFQGALSSFLDGVTSIADIFSPYDPYRISRTVGKSQVIDELRRDVLNSRYRWNREAFSLFKSVLSSI